MAYKSNFFKVRSIIKFIDFCNEYHLHLIVPPGFRTRAVFTIKEGMMVGFKTTQNSIKFIKNKIEKEHLMEGYTIEEIKKDKT